MLNESSGVHGLLKEGSPEYDGRLDPYYSTLLDEIAYVADETSGFVVPLSYGQAGASNQAQSRRVQEATMLLGYSPGHLVDWADLEQGSDDLAVWPEEGVYPTQPVQSMSAPGGSGCLGGTGAVCSTGGHNDLQVAPGVYRLSSGPAMTRALRWPVRSGHEHHRKPRDRRLLLADRHLRPPGYLERRRRPIRRSINPNGATFTPNTTTIPAQDAALLMGLSGAAVDLRHVMLAPLDICPLADSRTSVS